LDSEYPFCGRYFLHLDVLAFIGLLRLLLFAVGYVWMLIIPFPSLGRGVYIDENALQPGQVRHVVSYPACPVLMSRLILIGIGARFTMQICT
jgi:hypothetical protein